MYAVPRSPPRCAEELSSFYVARYPIYTCFKEWCFPPSLPAPWREYAIPPIADTRLRKVPERDSSCRLTLHADGCEIAHLVPTVDQEWFAHNQINRFVNQGDPQAINHHANAILLRADLHHLMDQRVWVPTLKEKKLLLCSMCKPPATPLSAHFRTLYQNCELQELKGVSKECIFARVAWAVMPLVKAFLQSRATEKSETTAVFDASGKEVYLSAASLQLKTIEASKSASRSASPKKRVRSADSAQDDAYNPQCCSWASFNDSAYGEVSGGYEYEACRHRSPSRGRKRRRVHRGSSDDEGLEMSEILARAVGEKQHMPKESIKEQSERNVDGLSATR